MDISHFILKERLQEGDFGKSFTCK